MADLAQLGNGVVSALAFWKDDSKYYKVDILQYDEPNQKCKVMFEDKLETWMDRKDIHLQLSLGFIKDDQIVCCICDGGLSQPPNELILCDVCQQGFHLQCQEPGIDRALLDDENNEWFCSTCEILCTREKNQPDKKTNSSISKKTPTKTPTKRKSKPITKTMEDIDAFVETSALVDLICEKSPKLDQSPNSSKSNNDKKNCLKKKITLKNRNNPSRKVYVARKTALNGVFN